MVSELNSVPEEREVVDVPDGTARDEGEGNSDKGGDSDKGGGRERWCLLPIQYPKLWEFYKKAQASYWTAEELDLARDRKDFDALSDDERHFIKMVLAFFASADGAVIENLGARFLADVEIPEARSFYTFQLAMEAVHAETYGLLIQQYVQDAVERTRLFAAVEHIPSIKSKGDWAEKWIDSSDSFAHRLVAFACVEGIFFSGSFCAIFWLKKRGLMPGLTFSNELISRDEGLHTDFACHLYTMLVNDGDGLPEETVRAIVGEAVDLEREFICESLPCALIGMCADSMGAYIEFVADRLMSELGCSKVYGTANPFPFMEQISLQGKSNFFEKRESSYAKANIMAALAGETREFKMDADF